VKMSGLVAGGGKTTQKKNVDCIRIEEVVSIKS